MMVKERKIKASEFKASCLALMDEIADSGQSLVVTKRGKPVVRVVPVGPPRSLRGSVRYLVSEAELLAPIAVEWMALRR